MLEDKIVSKFQAYILYSKNVNDILKRIVNYIGNCSKIIADTELYSLLKEICTEFEPHFTEIKDYHTIENLINNESTGRGIVFKVVSPINDVHAVAFIPINEFNKSLVSKR